jgi:hypothetical protein
MLGCGACRGVLMLWGFFDESGEHDASGGLAKLTLGGCWSSFEKWEAFSLEWQEALKNVSVNVFHMTDFEANQGEFKGWENNKEKHNALLHSLLGIMQKYIESYSGFTKPIGHYSVIEIYERHLVDLFVRAGVDEDHSVVIARHPEYSAHRMGQLVEAIESLLGRNAIKVKTWSIGEPRDLCPLQAADVVAYEIRCWARDKELRRPMRYPLRRLRANAKGWVLAF